MALRPQAQFVGRDRELEALGAAVDSARSGQPELVFIEGEAGLGKSRLLRETVGRHLHEGDLLVLAHGVDLMGDQLPFGIIAEAMRSLVRAGGPEALAALPSGAEAVANAFAAAEPGFVLERLRRVDLFTGFATLIDSLAARELVWLAVEDLHLADESSLELLAYVARVVSSGSLLTMYTVRTGAGVPSSAFALFSADSARALNASTITLKPLDRAAAESVVTDLTDEPPDGRLLDRLLEMGDGNPFLTEELVYGGLTADGPLPASPQAAMLARIGRLSDDAADLVRGASLAYGSFTLDNLRRLMSYDDGRLDAALDEGAAHRVIERETSSDGFRFHHALLKEAVAASLPPAQRRRTHRTWAEVREADLAHESDPWLATVAAAHHWVGSGDVERGFDACVRAVQAAAMFHVPSERAPLLAEALRLWDRVPDAESRSGRSRDQLAMETIRAAHFAGDWEGALELLDAELRHQDSDRDPVRRATLELSRQGTLEQLGRGVSADFVPKLDDMADLLLEASDGPWLANGCLDAAWRISVSPHPERALELRERAASAALAQDDPQAQLNAWQTLADNLLAKGRLDDAFLVLDDLVELTTTRLPERLSDAEAQLCWFLCFRGDLAAGLGVAERAMRRIPSSGLSNRLFAYVAQNLAYALIELGRWDEADRWLAEARTAYPHGWTAVEIQAESVRLACYRGDTAAADALAAAMWDAVPRDERDALVALGRGGTARIARATLAAGRGDVAGVREQLAPVWAVPGLREESDSVWRAVLVAASAEADAATRARRSRRRTDPQSTESERHVETLQAVAADLYAPGPLGVAWTKHLAAELSRFRQEDDADMWRDVHDAWEAIGVQHDRGWALHHLAECCLTDGERDPAQTAILKALDIATRLGAKPLETALLGVADRSRLRSHATVTATARPAAQVLSILTPREADVLKLIARGNSNNQIAGLLFISPKTVSVHVSHVLAKLEVRSRAEAAALAFHSGLVQD
jgi:DNA-binding CsgD family transcriptional regulator/tetratricopeptide (TPR) repeat protein